MTDQGRGGRIKSGRVGDLRRQPQSPDKIPSSIPQPPMTQPRKMGPVARPTQVNQPPDDQRIVPDQPTAGQSTDSPLPSTSDHPSTPSDPITPVRQLTAHQPQGWSAEFSDGPAPRTPHDPTGTDLAERIAAAARGVAAPKRRRRARPVEADEVRWSGAGPSRRDPQKAGQVLEEVLRRRGWKRQVSVASLMSCWPEFVGSTNAAHTKPEQFTDGVLLIRAESTTWATSLRAMAPAIIAKMNQLLGAAVISKLKIVGPQAPSWKHGLRSVPGRGPRDTYG